MTVRIAPLVVGILATASLVGCGLAAEDSAREIDPPPGPYSALRSPTPAVSEAGAVLSKLCLVRDGMLVAVQRRGFTEPTVSEQLNDLLAGPTAAERSSGITSALLGTVVEARLTNSEITVDITATINETGRNDEVLAFAQVVCTLTSRTDVSGVYFTRAGERVGVPRADGSLSSGPLTMADYASMVLGS